MHLKPNSLRRRGKRHVDGQQAHGLYSVFSSSFVLAESRKGDVTKSHASTTSTPDPRAYSSLEYFMVIARPSKRLPRHQRRIDGHSTLRYLVLISTPSASQCAANGPTWCLMVQSAREGFMISVVNDDILKG